jgi:DNA-directed RNA polymerase specialized sigma24 family protein
LSLRTESRELLLPRVAKGDAAAARLCVERWGDRLGGLVARFGLSGEAAERALRAIFSQLWDSAPSWRPRDGPEFLFAVRLARRWLLDHRDAPPPAPDAAGLADAGAPAGQTDLFGESARLMRAVGGLAAQERLVLGLCILHAQTYARVGELLGCDADEARTAARRALLRVRERLHADGPARSPRERPPAEARP